MKSGGSSPSASSRRCASSTSPSGSISVALMIKRQEARPIPATAHTHPVVREALERRSAYFAAKADALFELEAYLVVLFEGWAPRPSVAARLASLVRSPRTAWRELFSATATASAIEVPG